MIKKKRRRAVKFAKIRCDLPDCGNVFVKPYSQIKNDKFHFCNSRIPMCSIIARREGGIIQQQISKTCVERYGAPNPFQSDIVKEKIRQECLKNNGVEFHQQRDDVKKKIAETNLERYGNVCSAQSVEILQMMVEKFGGKSSFSDLRVLEKARETIVLRYGVENASQSDIIKEKTRSTCIEKYGVSVSSMNDDVKKKQAETNIEKYGFISPLQNDDIKEKMRMNNIFKFGVGFPLQCSEVMEKKKRTCIERYGVDCYTSSSEFKEKVRRTLMERYGVENSSQIPGIQDKIDRESLVRKRLKTMFSSGKGTSHKFLKRGIYSSSKSGQVPYDSGWEMDRMKELDEDDSVISWHRSSDVIEVQDGDKILYYNPDFEMLLADGAVVVEEVKGLYTASSLKKMMGAMIHYGDLGKNYRILTKKGSKFIDITTLDLSCNVVDKLPWM